MASDTSQMDRVAQAKIAKSQIVAARDYTQSLLADIEPDDYYNMAGGTSHIAWQCGHIAMGQYALGLLRLRSKLPDDQEFITSKFFKFFKKTSQPKPPAEEHPSLEETLGTMEAVHQQVLKEIDEYTEEQLGEELPMPYSVEATKLGSLYFCSVHEMLHAGQIGLLRRQLGKSPIR